MNKAANIQKSLYLKQFQTVKVGQGIGTRDKGPRTRQLEIVRKSALFSKDSLYLQPELFGDLLI